MKLISMWSSLLSEEVEVDVDVAMSGGADQKDAAPLDRNAMFSMWYNDAMRTVNGQHAKLMADAATRRTEGLAKATGGRCYE